MRNNFFLKCLVFFVLFLALQNNSSIAQTHVIRGIVYNVLTSKTIPDLVIGVKGTNIKVKSDLNGAYSLNLPDTLKTVSFTDFLDMDVVEIRNVSDDEINIYLKDVDLINLSLDDLLNIKVSTASNIEEKYSEVPATTIIVSKQDILERGYNNLSEMFSDLPGMDISQNYGEQPVFNYWRGFRTAYSQPYIFMIDGMLCNDVFYNQPQIMDNIPLSNIEKIEIVYGPVSALYGANAFMGVINVITKKNEKDGVSADTRTRVSNTGNFIGDMFTHYQKGKFRTSLAARFENTDLAQKISLDDYYTNKNFLTDTLLWGQLAKSANKNGKVSIPYSGKSIDFRLGYGNTELGIQVNTILSSYGLGTPFDKYLPNIPYSREFYYAWVKHEYQLNEKLTTNVTLRYCSENRKTGDWIEAYNYTNKSTKDVIIQKDSIKPNETTRVIDYSLWPLKNEKISFIQNFNLKLSEKFLLTSGLQFDQTYITKQEGIYGNLFTPNNVTDGNANFIPPNNGITYRPSNRVIWKDYSLFSQIKYTLFDGHIINLGVRLDDNSEYGLSKTFRGGYILNYKKITTKLLYGQAYQIPTPRTLYSSSTILGSSSDLKPERSETVELNVNYISKKISSWISTYYVRNKNTIVFIGSKAQNLAERNVMGIDAYMNLLVPLDFIKKFSVWGYYSMYVTAKEEEFNAQGTKTGVDDIGDLSHYKVYWGVTSYFTKKIMLNLRGRYISDRKAVSTNITSDGQTRVVDAYLTIDGNIMYQNLFVDGFSIALKVDNILNSKYYHPGINKADSGTASSAWSDGVWQGSKGWNNSLLPQPHRYFTISMIYNL